MSERGGAYGDYDKLHSNDWLVPVLAEAERALDGVPRDIGIEAAQYILKSEDSGQTDIPWATVFPSDDPDEVEDRLVTVFKTPDGQTPANDPQHRPVINDLKGILFKSGALNGRFTACHAAYSLVQTAAGKPDETFVTYTDWQRRYPQYAGEWGSDFIRQFGRILKFDGELRRLLMAQIQIERAYNPRDLMQSGETTVEFLTRAFSSLEVDSAAGLEKAAKIAALRHKDYRFASYELRGIPQIEA